MQIIAGPQVCPVASQQQQQQQGAAADDKGAIDHTKYKTKMCRNYLKGQVCPFGDRCAFAHGEVEVLDKDTAQHTGPAAHAAQRLQTRRERHLQREQQRAGLPAPPPLVAPDTPLLPQMGQQATPQQPPHLVCVPTRSFDEAMYVPQGSLPMSQHMPNNMDIQQPMQGMEPQPSMLYPHQHPAPLQPVQSFGELSVRSATPLPLQSQCSSNECGTPQHSSAASSSCPTPTPNHFEAPAPPTPPTPALPHFPPGTLYRYEPYGDVFTRVPSDMTACASSSSASLGGSIQLERVDSPTLASGMSEDALSDDLEAEVLVTAFA
eukprot:TRINITY_DN5869_c0_g1_i4.p2 TRINITY_DN5869_c0_g1~~TRINITY_DN5869_c0_g1_i4.p2  ORF type:complete len:320 (+),score=136.21 TRINITY_DN5869_c0_g1_i4:82-1041(+)